MKENVTKHHVVIVGMGFAGYQAYRELHDLLQEKDNVEITAIDDTDTFVFIPMIHEVATGLLTPESITHHLRDVPQQFARDIVEGVVISVDASAKTLVVKRTEGFTDTIFYDTLILALGSKINFFGIPGAAEHSFPLNILSDAKRIKNRIIEMFDMADATTDHAKRKEFLRFVIVGGGPTGVELAGEISDALSRELRDLFPHLHEHAEVILIDRGTKLIPEAGEWFSKRTERILEKKRKVKIMFETSAEEVTPEGITTSKGFLATKTVLWCAGISSVSLPISSTKTISLDERSKRIVVTPELCVETEPDIFVAGDQAQIINPKTGKPYGMRAQFAVRQGRAVARNIVARLRGKPLAVFRWQEHGFILSLGRGGALANVFGFKFGGFFAWLLFHGAYLTALVGVRAKCRTALEWVLDLFTPRDFSKV